MQAPTGSLLGYTTAFKRRRRRVCIRCLLLTLVGLLATTSLSLVRPDRLAPGSACQIMLAVAGVAALWLYRLHDLYARSIELTEVGLVLREPLASLRRCDWFQIQRVSGDLPTGTVTLHLLDGTAWPLPSPLEGGGRLWAALQRHLPERVETSAWTLLLTLPDGSAEPPHNLPPSASSAHGLDRSRRTVFTRRLWMGRFLLLALFVWCGIYLHSIHSSLDKFRSLAQAGQTTEGTVTGWHSGMLNGVTTYAMRFTFMHDKIAYTGESFVPAHMFRAQPVRSPCTITFLPGDPTINCQGSATERLNEQIVARALAIFVLLPILAYSLLHQEWEAHRERRLVLHGSFARAQVIEATSPRNPFARRCKVRYRFQTSEGELLLGTAHLSGRRSTLPGELLPVVFHPTQPRRHLLLAACTWVRLVGTSTTGETQAI
jgi:hypothetical protein